MNNIQFTISYKAYSYTVVYGQYINGYYIALPYCQVACDASDPDDTGYNQEKLYQSLSKLADDFSTGYLQELSRVLALAIQEVSCNC